MATRAGKAASTRSATKAGNQGAGPQVDEVVEALKRLANKKTLDGMSRFAIPSTNAFGVPVGQIRDLGKKVKKGFGVKRGEPNVGAHELSAELWKTGWYEARMLCAFVADPLLLTPTQMDAWCRDFDNWAICDTLCYELFDRTPHAFRKVRQWADKREEFVKRGSFALLAGLALHDKKTGDESFLECLPLIERAANDERNFVKKGVSWALRGVGQRSAALNKASVELARRLSESTDPTERWIGKDALKDITRPAVIRKFAAKRR